MYPSYLELYSNGQLNKRAKEAESLLVSCSLCPRKCGINRLKDNRGYCKIGNLARIYSYMPHLGEEPPISGYRGSGTIFFSGCNMACVYCQNYKFSQLNEGKEVEVEELSEFMLELQKLNCHNINLVTPSHILPQILKALILAIPQGLKLPLVYNTSGYELPETIKLLDGIVDIFLPDMRYSDNEMSARYSNAPDYPEYNQASVKQMYRQLEEAKFDEQGLIKKGLIIRHLVLPNNIAGTARIMHFIAQEISAHTYISLMSQYLPCHNADKFPELFRRMSEQEYNQAKKIMLNSGLSNGWLQEAGGLACLVGTNIKPIG
ncbi:MAG: radical SAM protein [Omnitrophica WOR_2 bacterium SM23_29]|nr:MAG: radical SAM protein [Omnitrophica WOR_2 bacterium SM23_29]